MAAHIYCNKYMSNKHQVLQGNDFNLSLAWYFIVTLFSIVNSAGRRTKVVWQMNTSYTSVYSIVTGSSLGTGGFDLVNLFYLIFHSIYAALRRQYPPDHQQEASDI